MCDSKTCAAYKNINSFFPFIPSPFPHPPPVSCQPPWRTASKIFLSNSVFLSKVNQGGRNGQAPVQTKNKQIQGLWLLVILCSGSCLERHSYSHPKLQFSLTVQNAPWTCLIYLWFNLLWAILPPHGLGKQGAREIMHVCVYSGVWVQVEESEV